MSNLLRAAEVAIASCRGDHLVASFFSDPLYQSWFDQPWYLIAVGKAAGAMTSGALLKGQTSLVSGCVVAKEGSRIWFNDARIAYYEAAHPIPARASFIAGEALVEFVQQLPESARILCLVSGGASALVERLVDGQRIEAWQENTQAWLASGWDIKRINQARTELSAIKGGRLLTFFPKRFSGLHCVISDVQGDPLSSIASGLCFNQSQAHCISSHILANNQHLLRSLSITGFFPHAIICPEFITENVDVFAHRIIQQVSSTTCYIWGGEPVVILPSRVGLGGRMQHLALLVSFLLKDYVGNWQLLAIGSDGSDGTSDASGAYVNQSTLYQARLQGWNVEQTINSYDAGSLLEDVGALIYTGDTGTNVNDMVILWCE